MSKIKLLNVEIDNLTMEETVEEVDSIIQKREASYIVTPNVDHIMMLEDDLEFKEAYAGASLVLADGMPLLWISKFFDKNNVIKEKVSGSDLLPKVCEMASQKGYSIFLLGAQEGVGAKAAERLKKDYPSIDICGIYSPKFGFEKDKEEMDKITHLIFEAKPDILVLGLGTPKQEKLIYKYKDKFNVPMTLPIGAGIDFLAGEVKRAPKWMRNCGLEWFYRLCKEPRRMFKRYILTDLKIVKVVFKYKKDRVR